MPARNYAVLVFILTIGTQISQAPDTRGEWYVAGYGGYSKPGSLGNVKMDAYGERQAFQQFPGAQNPQTASLTQSFSTSDINLKSSPLFGIKSGYFFRDEGLSWLGLELEAFTSKPTIKKQTVATHQGITFLPTQPLQPNGNPPCIVGLSCTEQRVTNAQLSLNESPLRVTTVAFNVIARYPGKVLQPYAGVGVGAFYFSSSGQIDGRQVVPGLNALAGLKMFVSDEWGLFLEGKYNRATFTNLDPAGFGLSGEYSVFNFLAGVAYHF